MVGKAVGVGNRKVEENTVASAFGGFENLVLLCRVALAYPGVHVHHAGIEPPDFVTRKTSFLYMPYN